MSSLIIDTDCGFDDLFAMGLLFYSKQYSVDHISIVSGMSLKSRGSDLASALFLSQGYYSKPSINTGSMIQKDEIDHLKSQDWIADYRKSLNHFKDYLIEKKDKNSAEPNKSTKDLYTTLSDISSEGDTSKLTLLCLGPLTNVAEVIHRDPNLLPLTVNKIVIMGGALWTAGNAENGAELNFFMDPSAAATVVHESGVPVEILGLDVANQHVYPSSEIQRFLEENKDKLVSIGLPGTLRKMLELCADSVSYDPVVAFYLMQESEFEMVRCNVKVDEVSGIIEVLETVGAGGTTVRAGKQVNHVAYINFINSILTGMK